MLTEKEMKEEIRKKNEISFSISNPDKVNEYINNINYFDYLEKNKSNFKNLIAGLMFMASFQKRTETLIKERVSMYGAIDLFQFLIVQDLNVWCNFIQKNKEDCLLHYRRYYNKQNPNDKKNYSDLWHSLQNACEEINIQQMYLNDIIEKKEIIDLYADDLSRTLKNFFNKKLFKPFRKFDYVLLTKEEESNITYESVLKEISTMLDVLKKTKDINIQIEDSNNYNGAFLFIKDFESYKNNCEYNYLNKRHPIEISLDKKEQKVLDAFKKRHK